ncbi:MAG: Aspartyl-tRNA synthetase, partial [Candidatus Woesebacteria bacterium GW2011_GWD1_47_21]
MADKRTLVKETTEKVGQKVLLQGWVDSIRDHGKIVFLDLRDRTGIVQCVGQDLPKVTPESVVEIKGSVSKRPDNLVNPNLETGTVEVKIENLEVISLAAELPIPISGEGLDINEVARLKYRYLDLR